MDELKEMHSSEVYKLTTTITTLKTTILNKDDTIFSLEEKLSKKADVEAQLAEALQREKRNNEAR